MKGKRDIKMRSIDKQNMIMSLKDEAQALEAAYEEDNREDETD
ncbi:MAG: hypothetical protein PHC84_00530 [Clostridia bacterium]|nr:hypothetical protein [Clostridia bacterium]